MAKTFLAIKQQQKRRHADGNPNGAQRRLGREVFRLCLRAHRLLRRAVVEYVAYPLLTSTARQDVYTALNNTRDAEHRVREAEQMVQDAEEHLGGVTAPWPSMAPMIPEIDIAFHATLDVCSTQADALSLTATQYQVAFFMTLVAARDGKNLVEVIKCLRKHFHE